jgi:hypothetical protein
MVLDNWHYCDYNIFNYSVRNIYLVWIYSTIKSMFVTLIFICIILVLVGNRCYRVSNYKILVLMENVAQNKIQIFPYQKLF